MLAIYKKNLLSIIAVVCVLWVQAQPVLQTGGKEMPNEWIDKDTRHKVIKLTRKPGRNSSFYFHNNPFVDGKMVFYSYDDNGKQLHTVDLYTLDTEQITKQSSPMTGEIVGAKTKKVYYQIKDSVFSTDLTTRATALVFVFPNDFKASITTLNADETLLAGARSTEAEREIFKNNPNKSDYFNKIYEAKLPRTLFTINVNTGQLNKLWTDSAWLNHIQFSPTDPNLLMFCHEGPWHKVDRMWTITLDKKEIKKIHTRTMDMEIAGHEWFAPDGKTIWFDLQTPRSVQFFVAGTDVNTLQQKKYALTRNEWSIHYNINNQQTLFCGDGGDSGQVARAKDGMWIYLFHPEGSKFRSEKLVNMKNHNYKLEPNVHFSPDGKWVIFRANFEGQENVYAVEI